MNMQETAAALAKASAYDNREASTLAIQAWHEALADLDLPDVLDAVARHYAESSAFLMPAHIREAVKRARRDRARPSLEAAKARAAARAACGLCDDHGYRLPARRVVCDHSERKQVGWAQRFRRQIEGGAA